MIFLWRKLNFKARCYRLEYSTSSPHSVFSYDLNTLEKETLKVHPVKGYQASEYIWNGYGQQPLMVRKFRSLLHAKKTALLRYQLYCMLMVPMDILIQHPFALPGFLC